MTTATTPNPDPKPLISLALGVRVARHDLGDFPARMRFTARHGKDGWSGRIIGPEMTTDFDGLVSVYYRRPSRFTFPPGMSNADRAYAEEEARLGVGGVLAALGCRWVNHPHDVARAEWKPLQIEVARLCGLATYRRRFEHANDTAELRAAERYSTLAAEPFGRDSEPSNDSRRRAGEASRG